MTILAWFARNGVAANLLMALIILGGVLNLGSIRKEVFAQLPTDLVMVSVVYPGASPEEVETAVCSRIENHLRDVESVRRIRSVAVEGLATVTVELLPGSDVREQLDEIKARIDTIDTLPLETEKPVVREIVQELHVLSVAISGHTDERTLRRLGEQTRDQILGLEGITRVELTAVRPYEIAIEVSEQDLNRFGLTFDHVATAVRRSSFDLPAGSVKSRGGEILLRARSQAYVRQDFESLVLLTRDDGTHITLGDVATVIDGFAEIDQGSRFDGRPAVIVQVFRVGAQHATVISDRVGEFVLEARASLPEGLEMTVWQDDAQFLRSRLGTLLSNGRSGLILVLLVLASFLRLRLAGWVALGIPISFLGTLWLMPHLDLTIDLLSLLAFIIVLGIVVDDAIVVGENIYRHHQMGKEGLQAAVDGVQEVATPIVFSILTSIAAFAPLALVPGSAGKLMRVIPLIVITTLVFSLLESLLILPSHLAHLRHEKPREAEPGAAKSLRYRLRDLQERFSSLLEKVVSRVYQPLLQKTQAWRYTTLAVALAALLLTLGYVAGGHLRFSFFPPVEAENMVAFLMMPQGTRPEMTAQALGRLEESAEKVRRELIEAGGPDVIRHIVTSIGSQPYRFRQTAFAGQLATGVSGSHLGEVNIELSPGQERDIGARELIRRWRERTGPIADAVELSFDSALFSTGKAVGVQLTGGDLDQLRLAAAELRGALGKYPGVFDITDSFRYGKKEINLAVTPQAESLGLTLADLAGQVRQAFYGEEAQRIQRGRDDVKVMVRYPADDRRRLASLENMRIRTPRGDEVPFSVVGRMELGHGLATIAHTDGRRSVDINADVDLEVTNGNLILAELQARVLPDLLAKYPGLRFSLEGEQRQQRETMAGLGRSFLLAMFLIYALLAVPFGSYSQPLIIMTAIPFGIIGAIWGHVLMGHDLTFFSFFGIVALTGVVVNDSLVLVDFVNRSYRGGAPLAAAILEAGSRRFRPIVLTSLTTFAGLFPLLLETSVQAQYLIPMAISLAFGVLFATLISLLLVPATYSVLEDLKAGAARLAARSRP